MPDMREHDRIFDAGYEAAVQNNRSSKAEVRNPLLGLGATRRLQAMDPEVRAELRALCHEVAVDARERAETCWRRHKAPMAAYWKAVSVYAGHLARALR